MYTPVLLDCLRPTAVYTQMAWVAIQTFSNLYSQAHGGKISIGKPHGDHTPGI